MLTYTGTVVNVVTMPAKTDEKTGEIRPARHVVQFMGKKFQDGQMLADLEDLKVEDPAPFEKARGKVVRMPVRHWMFEGRSGLSVPKGAPVEVLP